MELRELEGPVIVMMGVSGTGKSTLEGPWLMQRVGYSSMRRLSSEENLQRCVVEPLTDVDRWPWLRELSEC